MEVNNISAQLFNKQLKPSALASTFGCKDDILADPNLTTCVNNIDSDAAIENTFQKQLDLSDYYKGRSVFEEIKKDFMDRTMENENPRTQVEFPIKTPLLPPGDKAVPNPEVGPRDFLKQSIKSKDFFGKRKGGSNNTIMYLILAALLIFAIVFLLLKVGK